MKRSQKGIISIVVLAALIIMTIPVSVIGDVGVSSPTLEDTPPREYLWLNSVELSDAISDGKLLTLRVLDSKLSFILVPIQFNSENVIVVRADGSLDTEAAREIKGVGTYIGISSTDGLDNITATISKDLIDISFSYRGTFYWIEGLEVVDGDWYCALHSLDDVKSNGSPNLMNDVATIPRSNESAPPDMQFVEIVNGSAQISVASIQTAPSVEVSNERVDSRSFQSTPEIKKNKSCAIEKDPEYRVCRMIVAADYEYYHGYGSSWITQALSKLGPVSNQYMAQVGITFIVVAYVEVPTSAIPTSMTDALDVLDAFRYYMENYQGAIIRDVSHLCSGKDFDGNTLGAGYEQGVGASRWQNTANMGYSTSMLIGSWGSFVAGHELGHNLNGDHAWGGSGWMGNWPGSMTFDANNANRIRNWGSQTLDLMKVYNAGPSSISSDKLQSSGLYLQDQNDGSFYHPPGVPVTVGYSIKNTGTTSITLSYLFVAARDAGDVNRDFGYIYNVVISPGGTYNYLWTAWGPSSGGIWTLWPAYYVSGHYGPNQWLTIQPSVYYLKGSSICYEKNSQNNVCYFYKDLLLSTVQTPVVGSTVWFYFTLYNGNTGTSTNNYDFFFVLCRWGSNIKDFGITSALTLTQTAAASEPPGGGYNVFASRVIDVAGTWNFWPCYKITQGGSVYWGPMVYGISLTV
jgi:hypothetical protein